MKKRLISLAFVLAAMLISSTVFASLSEFEIKPFTPNDFYVFVKVFSEMRGPLRSEILKDKKTDFENADPLKYVEKVKNEKDVKKVIKANNLTWDSFTGLMGNVLLGYFSIQSEKTRAAMIKQLASYGLAMKMDQIPEEYRPMVTEVLKTDAGATLASAALDFVIEIPPGNVKIARDNQKDLDRMFYTKYWKDLLKQE